MGVQLNEEASTSDYDPGGSFSGPRSRGDGLKEPGLGLKGSNRRLARLDIGRDIATQNSRPQVALSLDLTDMTPPGPRQVRALPPQLLNPSDRARSEGL